MNTPAPMVGVNLLVALPNQRPPLARTMKVSSAGELMSAQVRSPQTKAPWWLALACLPAAKLQSPWAVFQ